MNAAPAAAAATPSRWRTQDGLAWLEFQALSDCPGIRHGIFSRQGGVSAAPFDSLNVGLNCGDSLANVRINRQRLQHCLGMPHAVYVRQVHGSAVHLYARDAQVGQETSDWLGREPPAADAMISDIPGLLLVIKVADCQAILLHDPQRRVVANIHAGWRGTVAGIVPATVAAMQQRFGCHPADLVAAISPSLGPCCAEFVNFRDELPQRYWPYGNERDHFDFWAISRSQLVANGVPMEQISLSGRCTRCDTKNFFSYRGERITGRIAAVIGLIPE